ncbi:MAG TPA: hypothetical protein DIT58_08555 [Porticoccaceae bacterium]|nr:hypothetical protein [Porticoccaceae bacterium]
MGIELLWWHWMVVGIILIMLEVFLASFISLWFGLGALVTGGVVWFFPQTSLAVAVLIWVVASSVFTLAWFKFFNPRMVDKTKAGISREAAIGETGQVVKAPSGKGRGVVRFSLPVLSEDEWPFICESEVAAGDRVVIRDFSGNALVVEKVNA